MTAQQGSSLRFECPSCGGRVKVPPGQAGQACQCPKCNAKIVAPGGSHQPPEDTRQEIDDDFFAEDPVAQPTPPQAPSPAPSESSQETDPQPSKQSPRSERGGEKETPKTEAKPTPSAGQTTERLEFGVECGLCATRLYATLDQVGKTLKCPDCHSKVLIKAPKKRPEPERYRETDEGDDFRLSEPVERPPVDYLPEENALSNAIDSAAGADPAPNEPPRPKPPGNPMADTARQAMAKAEAEVEAEEQAKPVLPDQPFKTGVLAFFLDPAAGVRWLVLTLMGHGFVTALCWAWVLAHGGAIQQFAAVFLSVLVVGLGLAFVLLSSACSVAIVQDTANGYDRIVQWPGSNIGEWMFEGFFIINSLLASAAPGALVMCAGISGWNAVLAGTATAVAFFPILLLSALEQASPLGFASPAIWKSLRAGRPRWVKFYLLSAGLAVLGLLAGSLLAVSNFFLWGLSCAALTAIGMVYFRLVGRLAWCLSEPDALDSTVSGNGSDAAGTQGDAEQGFDTESAPA